METIGEKIREIRKQKKMSQEELASRLGISRPTLIKYEKGLSEPPFDLVDMAGMVLNYDFIEDMPRTEFDELEWKYEFLTQVFAKMGFTFEDRYKLEVVYKTEEETVQMFKPYCHIFNKDHMYKIEEKVLLSKLDLLIEHIKLDLTAFLKEQTDDRQEEQAEPSND